MPPPRDPNKLNPADARVSIASIERVAPRRADGYVEAYRAAAYLETGTHLYLTREAQRAMVKAWRPPSERRPRRRWRMPRPGDALAWCIKAATFGLVRPCGKCGTWRARFNRAGWRGAWRLLPGWAASLAKRGADSAARQLTRL